jgi:hypothetical protein
MPPKNTPIHGGSGSVQGRTMCNFSDEPARIALKPPITVFRQEHTDFVQTQQHDGQPTKNQHRHLDAVPTQISGEIL